MKAKKVENIPVLSGRRSKTRDYSKLAISFTKSHYSYGKGILTEPGFFKTKFAHIPILYPNFGGCSAEFNYHKFSVSCFVGAYLYEDI